MNTFEQERKEIRKQLTTDLLIADIKKNKKRTLSALLFMFLCLTAFFAYICHSFQMFSFVTVSLIIAVIFAIVAFIVMYKGHSIIKQVKCNNIAIYEDKVIKKAIIRGGKGQEHYLIFKNYHPNKAPGIRVTEMQYDQCELDDKYYIICLKTTITNPYLLVYPVNKYILSEEMGK